MHVFYDGSKFSLFSLKFKVAKKPRIEPSAMLSSDSDGEGAGEKDKPQMPNDTQKAHIVPKDEDISGGDLSDMDDEDLSVTKSDANKKARNDDDEKKGKGLKDKRSRSYRGKADDMDGGDSDDAMLKKEDSSKKAKPATKELPLRYREEGESSVKRNRRSDRPQSPSSPPPVFDRRSKYGTSPRRYRSNSNRRRSQGSSSPHHRQQQQDSKTYRGGSGGHPYYGSWQRVKSPRPQQQRGRYETNRSRSPDKRHQGDDDQSWKDSRYSSQRGRADKRKSAGESSSEVKRRRTDAGGPRSPSATPPLPPDMEEPRPQLPTEPPPTQPEAPLPTEGSFMPSLKDTKSREPVTGEQYMQ